ncbi:MAG: TrkA family potassium uptake protein [Candidatus Acinetobacter avistercoris]|uniref:potassium channel family protein n=1 Tax=Acinetobacter sp. KS-LM10 TaxID=3120518 RepID=UPI001F95AD39|nr:TrkA family potassium uptake protein [Candidatus Acinetobacter avistercoris]
MALFAVIGLGSFGSTVALELTSLKHDVIGIDSEKKYVENISESISHAVIADATDEYVLKELNLKNCDAVVVAIGENIEASILCVLHLKNLGVEKILAKAKSKPHHMILSHLGIDQIIHPEEDMGIRVAQSLSYPMVRRYMALNDDHYIVKIVVGAHLKGIEFRDVVDQSEGVTPLLLQRGALMIYEVAPGLLLQTDDILILEGSVDRLRKLSSRFKQK